MEEIKKTRSFPRTAGYHLRTGRGRTGKKRTDSIRDFGITSSISILGTSSFNLFFFFPFATNIQIGRLMYKRLS